MSSINRGPKNTEQGNAYFINILATSSGDFRDSTGTTLNPLPQGIINATGGDGIFSAGGLMLRDLGKTIRIPGNSSTSSGNYQRTLRLVQRVAPECQTAVNTGSFVNFNEGVGGKSADGINGYDTFYIELNGSSVPSNGFKWARITV